MLPLGFAWQLPLLLLLTTVGPPGCHGDGNVGCLFSESLCIEDEWCFDDNAFGRCLPGFGSVVDDDLFRFNLDRATLHTFEREMSRLFALGYRWSHAYTQCELQAMLYSAKHSIEFDNSVCVHLIDQDLEGALKSLETEDTIDPESMAYVKFTPSSNDPHAVFADEVYFPQVLEGIESDQEVGPISNNVENFDYGEPVERVYYPEIVKKDWIPAMHRRSLDPYETYERNSEPVVQAQSLKFDPPQQENIGIARPADIIPNDDDVYNDDDDSNEIPNPPTNLSELITFVPFLQYLTVLKVTPKDIEFLLQPENDDEMQKLLQNFFDDYEKASRKMKQEQFVEDHSRDDKLSYLKKKLLDDLYDYPEDDVLFPREYNPQHTFRGQWGSADGFSPLLDNADSSDLFESRVYIDENDPEFLHEETGSGEHLPHHEIFRELQHRNDYDTLDEPDNKAIQDYDIPKFLNRISENPGAENKAGVFTEGGVVYLPDAKADGMVQDFSKPDSAIDDELLKQDLNKFLNEYDWAFKRPERLDVKKPGPPFDEHTLVTTESDNTIKAESLTAERFKKEPRGAAGHPNPSEPQYAVDTDYVYIGVKDGIKTWKEGSDIVSGISHMLNLDPRTLTHPRVGRNEVTFRVEPNKQGWNATVVANNIELIKDRLKEELGVDVILAGVGDKTKMPAILSIENHSRAQFYLIIIILCGIAGTLLLAIIVLVLIRSQILSRKKLYNMSHPDTEASKDYQDLCRARMATKGQQPVAEKAEGVHGRITSISRESEGSQNSPSSRSSTSSWSEEPALTNMDISTGHMVLTYMEDHLKNKDRLEQEWVALCAYEAEPCATTVALKPENVKKNRYMEILPYDHARVVLNDLTNMSGSDYINASSITDHDPRNPAYIATQGSLPHTAPDFWQMIWEQGSVVMVMLTRLTENGNAMCHRYWPEEGSEVYHIYEVHLVSEHIWCDDYLVRSFYLKNVKTGETRTVTQFHFLSWPDNGIPTSTKALLEFRRKVNKSYRGRSCPIAVHCSDGAGRTGTYCLIDMVLNRMAKGAKEIDIAATLEHIRDQRLAMVSTKQQFEFVLMAVAEEVHAILKALPAQLQQQQEKKDAESKEREKEKQ